MMEEDLSIFFDDFAVDCSANGHTFKGIWSVPTRQESFEGPDVFTTARSLALPTEDAVLAGLVQGQTVTVGGEVYPVRHPPSRSGCGRITTLTLGAPT